MTSEQRPDLSGLSGVVLTGRFLTELAMLAGLAVAGAILGDGVFFSIANAVLLPAAAAAVWGLFVAPRARRRLPEPARYLVEFALFLGTGLALALSDLLLAGILVAALGILFATLTRSYAKDG